MGNGKLRDRKTNIMGSVQIALAALLPLILQAFGITDPDQVAQWATGITQAVMGLGGIAMIVAAGDRSKQDVERARVEAREQALSDVQKLAAPE